MGSARSAFLSLPDGQGIKRSEITITGSADTLDGRESAPDSGTALKDTSSQSFTPPYHFGSSDEP